MVRGKKFWVGPKWKANLLPHVMLELPPYLTQVNILCELVSNFEDLLMYNDPYCPSCMKLKYVTFLCVNTFVHAKKRKETKMTNPHKQWKVGCMVVVLEMKKGKKTQQA